MMGSKLIITESERNHIRKLYENGDSKPSKKYSLINDQVDPDFENSQRNQSNEFSDTLSYAVNYDIDIKATASDPEYRATWEDIGIDPNTLPQNIQKKYPIFIPELLSGLKKGQSHRLKDLLDVVKLVEERSGFDVTVTGGVDKYHREKKPNSGHNTGKALDFVIDDISDKNQETIEEIIGNIASNEHKDLSFINEYKRDTGGTGGHFHISFIPEKNYYHFFDEGFRKEGDEHYQCCQKNPTLEFGKETNFIDAVRKGRVKEPITKLQPKSIDTTKLNVQSPRDIKKTPEYLQIPDNSEKEPWWRRNK